MKRRIDGTRRLVSSSNRGLSLGDSSRVTRTAGCKRPLRCWGNQQIRWSTSSAPPVVPEISPSVIARQRQSRTIAALISVVFVTAVLIEGNAKQGWIGKDPRPCHGYIRNPHGADGQLEEQVIRIFAKELKDALTYLGPAWIQAISNEKMGHYHGGNQRFAFPKLRLEFNISPNQ
ncbi:unnamed protein product [Cylindrotheca closterium]|uniref:Uncharacterized protein n=1 Tax=Cylindrotheca closterium TaxID=2856 RepID=A0AAD2CV75_9STRA|nr:unnamed protein product [Cylindrotheca closterium]